VITPTPAAEILSRTRVLARPALRAAVDRLSPRLRLPVEYHLGWVDVDGNPADGDGGKHVRAALAILAASAVGGDEAVGIPGAVAIELVHNFSLIHDDLMDDDRERRHRLTVWAAYGSAAAILAGDALVTLAVQLLAEQPGPGARRAMSELMGATAHMIDGQSDDLAFEQLADISLTDCLSMARAKTGALLGCAGALGALLADAAEAHVVALRTYGLELGVAFQAVDDVLGIWGDPEVTGKPVRSDLRQGKKTIPVVAALERADPPAHDELRWLLVEARTSDDSAARAATLVEEAGGRAVAEEIARSGLAAALDGLAAADVKPAVASDLEQLARFVVGRDR
jgi:geranylgeranyl diphosphate synthase, type I